MDSNWDEETSLGRLLYDDEAPRLRRPINATVLRFRRPAVLIVPLALVVAAILPAILGALLIEPSTPWPLETVAAVMAVFILIILMGALALARREERSFALLVPNTLSVAHALLALLLLAGFIVGGPLGVDEVPQLLAGLPGPAVPTFELTMMKAYVFLFLVVTAASILAMMLFRVLGFRRVVADAD